MRITNTLFLLLVSSTTQIVHGERERREAQEDNNVASYIRGGIATRKTTNNNKDHPEKKITGSSNLHEVGEVSTTRRKKRVKFQPKKDSADDYTTSTTATTGFTHSQLNTQHQANVSKNKNSATAIKADPSKRDLEDLDDEAVHCTHGTQYIVACNEGTEDVCLEELEQAGVEIINRIKGTDFFAVCVDSEEEFATLLELTEVDEIEEDPIRTLSHLPESEEIVDHRELQAESVPYGIEAVRAPEFWAQYSKRGEGVKVCVVDTGLKRNHEDIAGINVSGPPNSNNDLVTPWDQDGNGHGSHVTGTIAAEDNNRGVIGVAPGVSIFVARGT
jgi:hypothetical protein